MPLTVHFTDAIPELDPPPSASELAAIQALINAHLAPEAHSLDTHSDPPPSSSVPANSSQNENQDSQSQGLNQKQKSQTNTLHPSLPAINSSRLGPGMRALLSEPNSNSSSSPSDSSPRKLSAIDLSRYEALDLDPDADLSSLLKPSASASKSTNTSTSASGADPDTGLGTSALERAAVAAVYLGHRQAHLALLDEFGRRNWLSHLGTLEAELEALERRQRSAADQLRAQNEERRLRGEAAAAEARLLDDSWRSGVGRLVDVLAAGAEIQGRIERARRGEVGVDQGGS